MRNLFGWTILGFCILSLLGCGGAGTSTVTGKVTIGGQPAAGVMVSFMPVDPAGTVASGKVESGGTYRLYSLVGDARSASEGALPGQYKVVLSQVSNPTEADFNPATSGGQPGVTEPSFPKEYLSAETSPKTVDVVAGANEINLDL